MVVVVVVMIAPAEAAVQVVLSCSPAICHPYVVVVVADAMRGA